MVFQLAKIYAHFVSFLIHYAHYCPPGLGWLLRRVRGRKVITIQKRKFILSKPSAGMFGLMILNRYPEMETHTFLKALISACEKHVTFIDVGAAIGEFAIDVAGEPGVKRVLAIDPDEDNIATIKESAKLNGFENIVTHAAVVADCEKEVNFVFNRARGASGFISDDPSNIATATRTVSLDGIYPNPGIDEDHVVLIDVEGAELQVVMGASRLIKAVRPLIVFEYNGKTREHFALEEMRSILGENYEIFRLNEEGRLDRTLDDTWNCVAIASNSAFMDYCRPLIDHEGVSG